MTFWIRANKISVIRFFLFRIWRPITSFLLSNLEALWYVFRRREAMRDLRRVRDEVIFVRDISFWYSQHEFEWKPDPAGGAIDFVSKPWVSVAKNSGDCDDMMAIALFVLKSKVDELHRASTYKTTGGGHAVVVARTGDAWTLITNQYVREGFASPQDAVKSWFGDETGFMYIYGVGAYFPLEGR